LVKTARASDGSPIFIDQSIISYSEKVTEGSPQFASLLKTCLTSFCGNPNNCNIWAMMTADEVNVHHIKIPRIQKKQLENTIYWAAKKEISFDENDFAFDYELQGEISEQGIPKYSIMVYSAPKAEIGKIKALFDKIGIKLTGITIIPFAIQNIFRRKWLPTGEGTIATLFIGNEFSRINIYYKDNLMMTRGIKTGASSMMEAINESISEKKGALTLSREDAKKILFSLGTGSDKLKESDAGFGLKEEEIFRMITPVIERLARQIERTLGHYSTSLGHERIERLYISSTMNIHDHIAEYISEQLGIKSEIFDPFKYQVINPVADAITLPDRMSLVPALGLSFSDNQRTPNLIFTYREKNKEISRRRINRIIYAAFAASLVICLTIIINQGMGVIASSKQRTSLKKELSLFNPLISADKVNKLASDVKVQRNISKKYAERYLGIAVIGEIAELTPENIRLNNLKIITPVSSPAKNKTDKTVKDESTDGLTMEGIITGERNMLESYLAQYLLKLSNSPMLRQVAVSKSTVVNFKKNDVLQFTMSAKIGR
jgi:type IV pilus assembly protein PilM